jgi:hypothetical protein
VQADHRSVHPDFPGVPWWGAVLLAVTLTAVGFAYDAGSGSGELGSVFAACFGLGCVLAVLAVRQSSIFTAVIQPPLLLFVAVPGAYFLFHSSEIKGLKDLAINCGYPLIERFPLMFFTSAIVLLLGAARWFLGRSARASTATPEKSADKPGKKGRGLMATVASKVSAATTSADSPDSDEPDDERPRRPRTAERPRRTSKTAAARKSAKSTKRSGTPSRSRHARPADTEIIEPIAERPRRSRPARTDDDQEPRRRPREQREGESRATRQPRESRESRQPRESRKVPPVDRRSTYERPERRRRYDGYEPLEPHGNGNGSSSSTHHPVSRVRYRGGDDAEERTEYRSRPRASRSWDPDAWEYDV